KGNQQIRNLAVFPQRSDKIEQIELIKARTHLWQPDHASEILQPQFLDLGIFPRRLKLLVNQARGVVPFLSLEACAQAEQTAAAARVLDQPGTEDLLRFRGVAAQQQHRAE